MSGLRFHNLSLKWKSLLIFMMLVSLPTSVLGIIVLYQTDLMLRRQAVESAARTLDIISESIASIVENVQDISSYMIYDIQFRKYFTYRYNDTNPGELSNIRETIHAFNAFQVLSKKYLSSIQLEGSGSTEPFGIGDQLVGDESSWLRLAEMAQGSYVWSTAYPMKDFWTGSEKHVITLFRQIKDINDINKTIGTVRIRLNERSLNDLISSKGAPGSSGTVFIVDNRGEIISHPDKLLIGTVFQDEMLIDQMGKEKKLISFSNTQDKYVMVAQKISALNWYVVFKVDEWEIVKNLDAIRTSIKAMILFSVIMGMLALVGFYWFLLRPILKLTRVTLLVEQGDFNTQVDVDSHDEIGRLGLRFNKMVKTIQRLIETKYQLELQHRESELKALQNQIDPHFLYNTLDAIHWTARMEQAMETSTLILALSKLFRISLSQGKLYILLKRELEYVNYYLFLQKKRLPFDLQFAIEADPPVQEALVPKKIIQPLVENSIVHGFQDFEGTGFIRIRCSLRGECVVIDVTDSGKGFEPALMQRLVASGTEAECGFALNNIQKRIRLVFGAGYGMDFYKGEAGGAHVRITIPNVHSEEKMSVMLGRGQEDHEAESTYR